MKATTIIKPIVNVFTDNDCRGLTLQEINRVSDLNKVWDYLYKHSQYELCDAVSREIGIIKGTMR